MVSSEPAKKGKVALSALKHNGVRYAVGDSVDAIVPEVLAALEEAGVVGNRAAGDADGGVSTSTKSNTPKGAKGKAKDDK